MATHIVTLKDNNNDISYPITPVDAVFVDSNTTLADALDDKAETDFSNVSNGSIAGNKLNFSTLAFGNYSTSEVDTGFTWVDGKAIYKKTVDFGYLPNNSTKSVDHNISNLDKIIKVEQHVDNGSNATHGFVIIPSATAANAGWNLYGNDTQIKLVTTSDRSTFRAYFTLYYTKSS